MSNYILAIDQGTSSSRCFIVNRQGEVVSHAHNLFDMIYPQPGWVEQDPEQIWRSVIQCMTQALQQAACSLKDIQSIGITNQRETTVVWDKNNGKAVYAAINWQDRRTKPICHALNEHAELIQQKTGLVLDPYFSASKIKWVLDNVPKANEKALQGDLLFGTMDTFLIWRLTQGAVHATDVTNASRTMLYNLSTQNWDNELLNLFSIPESLLPTVKSSTDDFGVANIAGLGEAPIRAVVGDQQAALVGQNCLEVGQAKLTFGTGCFALVNTADEIVLSQNRMITTHGYRFGHHNAYALEGSIFIAGALVQWLRDNLKCIKNSAHSEMKAQSSSDESLVFVPALTGLGAPHWTPDARGTIFGIHRDTNQADIVKAALEGIVFQTMDLMRALVNDSQKNIQDIRVDGGMAKNNWFLQSFANAIGCRVTRAKNIESSVLGAAWLASEDKQSCHFWQPEQIFEPHTPWSEAKLARWHKAVQCVKQFCEATDDSL